ncbi:hypothetical protein VNO77_41458 [Canavalia gladiata]|uniref:Uncharacterized protein n=1 Tax=Canavalia gladiata TaxID=3824 RepID=A0AAN9JZ35_CANGL
MSYTICHLYSKGDSLEDRELKTIESTPMSNRTSAGVPILRLSVMKILATTSSFLFFSLFSLPSLLSGFYHLFSDSLRSWLKLQFPLYCFFCTLSVFECASQRRKSLTSPSEPLCPYLYIYFDPL